MISLMLPPRRRLFPLKRMHHSDCLLEDPIALASHHREIVSFHLCYLFLLCRAMPLFATSFGYFNSLCICSQNSNSYANNFFNIPLFPHLMTLSRSLRLRRLLSRRWALYLLALPALQYLLYMGLHLLLRSNPPCA